MKSVLIRAALAALACVALLLPGVAEATFPGQNGKILFVRGLTMYTVNADGSGLTPVGSGEGGDWSPDGQRIAFAGEGSAIYVMNADGSNRHVIAQPPPPEEGAGGTSIAYGGPAWSPDASEIVFTVTRCSTAGCDQDLAIMNADGSGQAPLPTGTCSAGTPDWAPDGSRIAFTTITIDGCGFNTQVDIYTIRPDGTDVRRLTADGTSEAWNYGPSWSPDMRKILFRGRNHLETMNPDGSGRAPVPHDGYAYDAPRWSPDGRRIVFQRWLAGSYHLWVMESDGSNGSLLASDNAGSPDWQPIPVNAYPRPKGATPFQVALVPAYESCASPNRTHGPPLAFASCNPPAQSSGELTVGTADANAKPAKSRGLVRFESLVGTPGGPDDSDVHIQLELLDVYEQQTLADYAGQVEVNVALRMTDKLNTPHPGGPGAATVVDAPLSIPVSCSPTADTNEGASCNATTTMDAVVPGAVPEGRRAIWAFGAVEVRDAAGDAFMRQGIFVP